MTKRNEIKVCPECLGMKRLSDKRGSKADFTYGYIDICFRCNGSGEVNNGNSI